MSLVGDAVESITVDAFPAVGSRLLAQVTGREDFPAYQGIDGYLPIRDRSALLESVRDAGLRGRGGAAFPTARKLEAVRAGRTTPVVVANGAEGEPLSVKDRWLLRHRPHLVLDGVRIAAELVDTTRAHVFLSDPSSEVSVRKALAELAGNDAWSLDVEVTVVDPAYVAGEETAVVRALNGGRAVPTDKPPRPYEEGVAGRPTLVSNVETLANLPLIQRLGVDGYRALGVASSPGTFLLTLTGMGTQGLYEVPFGVTLREVLEWLDAPTQQVKGFLVGGYFAGVVGPTGLDMPLDYDAFTAIGSGLGCGAVGLLQEDMCPTAVTADVMTYFARENAGQCGSCFNGTPAMAAVLDALRDFRAEESDVSRLEYWAGFLRGRGACGTLDGATNVAGSLLREFPDTVAAHLVGDCTICSLDDKEPS